MLYNIKLDILKNVKLLKIFFQPYTKNILIRVLMVKTCKKSLVQQFNVLLSPIVFCITNDSSMSLECRL